MLLHCTYYPPASKDTNIATFMKFVLTHNLCYYLSVSDERPYRNQNLTTSFSSILSVGSVFSSEYLSLKPSITSQMIFVDVINITLILNFFLTYLLTAPAPLCRCFGVRRICDIADRADVFHRDLNCLAVIRVVVFLFACQLLPMLNGLKP